MENQTKTGDGRSIRVVLGGAEHSTGNREYGVFVPANAKPNDFLRFFGNESLRPLEAVDKWHRIALFSFHDRFFIKPVVEGDDLFVEWGGDSDTVAGFFLRASDFPLAKLNRLQNGDFTAFAIDVFDAAEFVGRVDHKTIEKVAVDMTPNGYFCLRSREGEIYLTRRNARDLATRINLAAADYEANEYNAWQKTRKAAR